MVRVYILATSALHALTSKTHITILIVAGTCFTYIRYVESTHSLRHPGAESKTGGHEKNLFATILYVLLHVLSVFCKLRCHSTINTIKAGEEYVPVS